MWAIEYEYEDDDEDEVGERQPGFRKELDALRVPILSGFVIRSSCVP